MNDVVIISRKDVNVLINTLTQIDVRGYPSMDKLVASVSFLENLLKQEQAASAGSERKGVPV